MSGGHNDCGYDEGCCSSCCECECHAPEEPAVIRWPGEGDWQGPYETEKEYKDVAFMRALRDGMRRIYSNRSYTLFAPTELKTPIKKEYIFKGLHGFLAASDEITSPGSTPPHSA